MLKLRVTNKEGRVLLGLGLESGNIKRLQNHDPILFNLEELGEEFQNIEVLIVAGTTQQDILSEFRRLGLIID